jgi:hypothetical protein
MADGSLTLYGIGGWIYLVGFRKKGIGKCTSISLVIGGLNISVSAINIMIVIVMVKAIF